MIGDFHPNGFPYRNSMLFPSKREVFDDKRSDDRKRLEEKRKDERSFDDKRFDEESRDEEKRAWDDFLEDQKRSDEDRKREIEKRYIHHFGNSPLDQLEQVFLRKWFPTENWKRSADSLGNARNGLSVNLSLINYD